MSQGFQADQARQPFQTELLPYSGKGRGAIRSHKNPLAGRNPQDGSDATLDGEASRFISTAADHAGTRTLDERVGRIALAAGRPINALTVAERLIARGYSNADDTPPLRELCGRDGSFPVRRACNRFIRRLADHADLVADALAGVAEGLKDLLPDLGQPGAVESTALRTPSNPNRREVSDPEASWGVKPSVKSKNRDSTEGFFGYKRPAVADANYGIPLAQVVATGRRNDSPELPALMARDKARHSWFQPAVALADRGYDAASNHQYLRRQGIIPVIHIRRPSNRTGLYQDIYTQDGVPTCLGMVPMEYVTTNGAGHHLYRCRREGCHLLAAKSGLRPCDTEYWQDPAEGLRLFGVIRRQSRRWKELYGKRWKIEQTFKSLKESRRLDSLAEA